MTQTPDPASKPLSESDEAQFKSIYFGFASNISPRSLQQRCPGSIYIGIAKLKGWRFIISESGFGNIIPGAADDEVFGSLHFLTAQHEAALDTSEEVPKWHLKKNFRVVRAVAPGLPFPEGEELEIMTYVDMNHTTEGNISKEYIPYVRKAISDGIKIGVPAEYFKKYWQHFLPEDQPGGIDEGFVMQRTIAVDREDLRYVPKGLFGSKS